MPTHQTADGYWPGIAHQHAEISMIDMQKMVMVSTLKVDVLIFQ